MSTTRRSSWVPKTTVADKVGYCDQSGRPFGTGLGLHLRRFARQQEQGCGLSLCAVDASARIRALKNVMKPVGLRDPFRISHYANRPTIRTLWPRCDGLSEGAEGWRGRRLCRLLVIETFKYQDAMSRAVSAAIGGEDPQGGTRRHGGRMGSDHRAGRRRQAARGLQGLGGEAVGLSRVSATHGMPWKTGRPFWAGRRGRGPALFVAPAIFVMLLVGLLPFLWSVVVSFQNITGSNPNGSLGRLRQLREAVSDARRVGRAGPHLR